MDRTVYLLRDGQADERGRFAVWSMGYLEHWTIEQIREAVAEGRDLKKWSDR